MSKVSNGSEDQTIDRYKKARRGDPSYLIEKSEEERPPQPGYRLAPSSTVYVGKKATNITRDPGAAATTCSPKTATKYTQESNREQIRPGERPTDKRHGGVFGYRKVLPFGQNAARVGRTHRRNFAS